MRFLMVDRICELERGKRARGIKNISWDDDFLEEIFPDIPVFSPIIATEAAAQLVSWIIIEAKDFTVKPVITVVDSYICNGHIMPGDQLELEGEIESLSEESALAHSRILLNGKPVIELKHAVCYLYPLSELDTPEKTRIQFKNLYTKGYPLPHKTPLPQSRLMREKIPINKRRWVDRIIDYEEHERIMGIKNVTATEDYFNDHFPLKPILPGVMILESLIGLSGILVERLLADQGFTDRKPLLKHSKKIKFRRFVQPGDQLVIDAKLIDFTPKISSIKAKATVNEKTAATISIEFEHLDREEYKKNYLIF